MPLRISSPPPKYPYDLEAAAAVLLPYSQTPTTAAVQYSRYSIKGDDDYSPSCLEKFLCVILYLLSILGVWYIWRHLQGLLVKPTDIRMPNGGLPGRRTPNARFRFCYACCGESTAGQENEDTLLAVQRHEEVGAVSYRASCRAARFSRMRGNKACGSKGGCFML